MGGDLIIRVLYDGVYMDLDVDSNIPLRLDISAVENTDIGAIYGVGSQTFNLPGTRKNNSFFRGAYNVSAVDIPAMYNSIDCSVIYNGETLLTGELQLNEIITDQEGYVEYVVSVADETVQFTSNLEGLLIRDADFSAYEHTLTTSSILDSFETNPTSLLSGAIFYPLVDYGVDDETKYPTLPRMMVGDSFQTGGYINSPISPLQLQQFLPAIRARELIGVIFDQVGFTYTSSLIDSSEFDNLYVLPKGQNDLGIVLSGSSDGTFEAIRTTSQTIATSGSDIIVEFNDEISDPSNTYSTASYQYTAGSTGQYAFNSSVAFNSPAGFAQPARVTLSLRSGAAGTILLDSSSVDLTYTVGGFSNILSVGWEGQLNPNDTVGVYIKYEKYSPVGVGELNPLTILPFSNIFECSLAPPKYENSVVNMAYQFESKTKSIDLLKGILTKYNAVAVPEPNQSKTIRIENFQTYIDTGREIDWTDRYDTATRTSIKHPVAEQSKQILLKDANDQDRFSKLSLDNDPNYQYGTLRITADSNVAQGEKTIESVYAPTILAPIIQSGSVDANGKETYNLSTGSFVVPHLYRFDNNAQKTYQFKPRLGYKVNNLSVDGGGGSDIAFIGTPNGSTISFTKYATISNVDSLPTYPGVRNLLYDNQYFNLAPTLIGSLNTITNYQEYWEDYINGLYWDEGRKITLDLKFSPTEYKNIRLNDRIFISGEQYRINKISGYNLQYDDVVTVELIKLARTIEVDNSIDCTLFVAASYNEFITPTPTATQTPTVTPTNTPTSTLGADCTLEVSSSYESQITPTPTGTGTPTPTPTNGAPTQTPTNTPTNTPTPTGTSTPTQLYGTSEIGSFANACNTTLANSYYSPQFIAAGDLQNGDRIYTDAGYAAEIETGYYGLGNASSPATATYYIYYVNGTGITTSGLCSGILPTVTPTQTPTNTATPTPTPTFRVFGTSEAGSAYYACNFTTPNEYFSPQFSNVNSMVLGDRIYTDEEFNNELAEGYYGLNNTGSPDTAISWIYYIPVSGVDVIGNCSDPLPSSTPTPTPTGTATPTPTPLFQIKGTSEAGSPASACNFTTPNFYYSPDFNNVFSGAVNDLIYTDEGYTNELATGWYGLTNNSAPSTADVYVYYVNGSGIQSTGNCGDPLPTVTPTATPTQTATPTPSPQYQLWGTSLTDSVYNACNFTNANAYYSDDFQLVTSMTVGDRIYLDEALTIELGNGYVGLSNSPSPNTADRWVNYTTGTGITEFGNCNDPLPSNTPTPTPTSTATPTPSPQFTIKGTSDAGGGSGACSFTTPNTYYSPDFNNVFSAAVNDRLYTDASYTTELGTGNYGLTNNSAPSTADISIDYVSGTGITAIASCTDVTPTPTPTNGTPTPTPTNTPTSTPPAVYNFALTSVGFANTTQNCGNNTQQVVYTGDSSITLGSTVAYTDAALTNPFNGSNLWWGFNSNQFTPSNFTVQIGVDGTIINASGCP